MPFEITADPFYSSENTAVLDRRIADIKAGRNISEHELIEAE
ncbi:antitoxin [Lachnospiraceae bacterium oral taxon 500]|nr:antitoxin [Lachnospiraceae bacterium oral taxon 500]